METLELNDEADHVTAASTLSFLLPEDEGPMLPAALFGTLFGDEADPLPSSSTTSSNPLPTGPPPGFDSTPFGLPLWGGSSFSSSGKG